MTFFQTGRWLIGNTSLNDGSSFILWGVKFLTLIKSRVRQCEFGKACLDRLLGGGVFPIKYFGLVKDKYHAELNAALESQVYSHWDDDTSLSPPKQRPVTERRIDVESMGLELIPMQDNHPIFPTDVLLNRFQEGSAEHDAIKQLKAEFESKFPPAVTNRSQQQRPPPGRATGQCDFSIDSGARPLDTGRDVDLQAVPIAECPTERLCSFLCLHVLVQNFRFENFEIFISRGLTPCQVGRGARQGWKAHGAGGQRSPYLVAQLNS